jgi:high-affinity iron transporter
MVGQTARTMQGTGWLSITSTDVIAPPYWMQLWFGVYPTVETIGAQIAAAVFVIGSYFLAQEVRVKRPKRRRRRESAAAAEAAPVTVNGNGRHSESELIER